MSITIAVSGKGGVGKTTLAAMLIRLLCGKSPVLAVDADANSCLGSMLGVEPVGTIAEVREKAAEKKTGNAGMDRVRSFEYGIEAAITEAEGFDLLTMGRPEGPGCYCAANNLLREFLSKLSSQYEFVVIDNEAGMEHLSRQTTSDIDLLFIIAEPTPLGAVTAERIFDLAKKLPISVKHTGVIWNKIDSANELNGIEIFGSVPYDEDVFNASMQGKTMFDIGQNSPAFAVMRKILDDKLKEMTIVD